MSAWATAKEGNENLLVRLISPARAGLARTSASGSSVRQLPWLTDGVVAGPARAIDSFFALTAEQKMAYRGPAVANRGYSPPRSEALSLSAGAARRPG